MAENENGEEKTEQPTAKKRKDERKKGNVLKSQDIAIVIYIFLVFFGLRLCAKLTFHTVQDFMTRYMSSAGMGIGDMSIIDRDSFIRALSADILRTVGIAAGILLVLASVAGVLGTGIQTKFLVTREQMKFKMSKLNPFKGIKNMFSMKKLFELAKNLVKMTILVLVAFNFIKGRITDYARMMQWDVMSSVVYIANSVFTLVMTIGGVLIAISAVDFMYQRWHFENELKMTKQEVKDEFKQMEGDPKIKGKRMARQREMAMSRMMQSVPEADVVIRNPTHFAVAVLYDPDKNSAPVVVAKGTDLTALRIVDVAVENDVPWVENKPLARTLYDKVEIGQEIPPDLYQAVAEVLAFVYELKNRKIPLRSKEASAAEKLVRTPYSY